MRVTVIVPAFDAAATLGAALASVAAQTRRPDQVIVVDDGSRDETAACATRFASVLPLRVIRLEANGGLPAARHAGITAADGDLVALLDADDAWLPDHLEQTVPLAGANTIVSANGRFWDPANGVSSHTYQDVSPVPAAHAQLHEILRRDFVMVGAVFHVDLYRRVGGYRREANGAENWDLWIRMLRAGGVVMPSAAPTYLYRRSPNSMSTGRGAIAGEVRVLQGALRDAAPTEARILRRTLRHRRAVLCFHDALSAARGHKSRVARRYAANALSGSPAIAARAAAMLLAPRLSVRVRDAVAR